VIFAEEFIQSMFALDVGQHGDIENQFDGELDWFWRCKSYIWHAERKLLYKWCCKFHSVYIERERILLVSMMISRELRSIH